MTWTDILKRRAEGSYAAAAGLFKLVDKKDFAWKPATGNNWLNTGQLLLHIAHGAGGPGLALLSGDWKDETIDPKWKPSGPQDFLPPAEFYKSVSSVDDALKQLAADHKKFLKALEQAGEKDLDGKMSVAPWGGPERCMGEHLESYLRHLDTHRCQLFYYLKLQGKKVGTNELWGG